MASLKRIFRFDKKKRRMVEVTPEGHRAITRAMSREVAQVRRRLAKRRRKQEANTKVRLRAKWPIVSEAMAIDKEDIPMAQEILRKAGVKTEYTASGEPILRSTAHRKQHAHAMGFYDRNGGYGDPAPRNR